MQWRKHTDVNCDTCSMYGKKSKGGRKPKPQKGGRYVQSNITQGQMLQRLNSLVLTS